MHNCHKGTVIVIKCQGEIGEEERVTISSVGEQRQDILSLSRGLQSHLDSEEYHVKPGKCCLYRMYCREFIRRLERRPCTEESFLPLGNYLKYLHEQKVIVRTCAKHIGRTFKPSVFCHLCK